MVDVVTLTHTEVRVCFAVILHRFLTERSDDLAQN